MFEAPNCSGGRSMGRISWFAALLMAGCGSSADQGSSGLDGAASLVDGSAGDSLPTSHEGGVGDASPTADAWSDGSSPRADGGLGVDGGPTADGGGGRACDDTSGSTLVYHQDFSTPPGGEWSNTTTATAPHGERFLGRFSGYDGSATSESRIRLTLAGLPAHTTLKVSFDLYVIGDWLGNATDWTGDHFFGVRALDPGTDTVVSLLRASSSNSSDPAMSRSRQSFPDSFLVGDHAAMSGGASRGALGYGDRGGDTTYHLTFDVTSSASSAVLEFFGQNLAGSSTDTTRTWGLDNIEVRTFGGSPVNTLAVSSAVAGKVYVDDVYTGLTTPAVVPLAEGRHVVGIFTDDGRYQHAPVTLSCDNQAIRFEDANWLSGKDWKFLVVALTHLDFDFSNVGGASGHCKATAPAGMGQRVVDILNADVPLIERSTGGLVHWRPTLTTLDRPQTKTFTGWIGEDDLPEIVSSVGWAEYDYILVVYPGYATGCKMNLGIFGASGATDLSHNSRGAGWGNFPEGDTLPDWNSYDGYPHEWGHTIEWLMESHGSRLPWGPDSAVHAGVAYGYAWDGTPNPEMPGQNWNWFHWYRDLFSGQVPDHLRDGTPTGPAIPGFVGVGPEAWLHTNVRDYALAVYPGGQ
jgi:hypothetical protein